MGLIHFFRTPGASATAANTLLQQAREKVSADIQAIDSEFCFNIKSADNLTTKETSVLSWLLSETFEPDQFSPKSFLKVDDGRTLVEVGPRLNFSTAWSTNAVSVCKALDSKVSNGSNAHDAILYTVTLHLTSASSPSSCHLCTTA